MAGGSESKRKVQIRNLNNGLYFFSVDGDIAKRARAEQIPGISMTLPMVAIGPRERKADEDPNPDITIPMWLWEAMKAYDGPASLKAGEREHRGNQGKFIAGLMNNNPPDIIVDVKRA
jgi:hypothetical protein